MTSLKARGCRVSPVQTLTQSDLEAIIAKVGKPRTQGNPKIVLDIDRVRAMQRAGFSMSQVGEYLGVSEMTVYRRLREAALPQPTVLGVAYGRGRDSG